MKMANGVSVVAQEGALLDTVQVQVTVFAPDSNSAVPGYQNSGFIQVFIHVLLHLFDFRRFDLVVFRLRRTSCPSAASR
jgi:hypothetical protein